MWASKKNVLTQQCYANFCFCCRVDDSVWATENVDTHYFSQIYKSSDVLWIIGKQATPNKTIPSNPPPHFPPYSLEPEWTNSTMRHTRTMEGACFRAPSYFTISGTYRRLVRNFVLGAGPHAEPTQTNTHTIHWWTRHQRTNHRWLNSVKTFLMGFCAFFAWLGRLGFNDMVLAPYASKVGDIIIGMLK